MASKPGPDLVFLRPPLALYGKRIPVPTDALLVATRRLERGAEVAPAAFPDISLEVDDILG